MTDILTLQPIDGDRAACWPTGPAVISMWLLPGYSALSQLSTGRPSMMTNATGYWTHWHSRLPRNWP